MTLTIGIDRDRVSLMTELREQDLKVEPVWPVDGTAIQGPRGVRITHVPTGTSVTSVVYRSQLENKSKALKALRLAVEGEPKRERVNTGNTILVPGSDMVGQIYFVKAGWPKCVDCDGWAIGMAVEEVNGEDIEIPVCAVDGFHRAADGQRIRRFEDEDILTRGRYS